MSALNGYTVKLVYYGRADFKRTKVREGNIETFDAPAPQISTQNVRIVPFAYDSESFPEVAIYEIVKNAEAKSDLEGTKI